MGRPAGPLIHVANGWGGHNRVYRLDTADGSFAVKRYGRSLGDGDPPRDGFAVELAAWEGGIPMARPVPAAADGGCWAAIGGAYFRCHEWVDGAAKWNEEASAAEAEAMGRIVAHLHGLAIDAGPLPPPGDRRPQLEALLGAGAGRRAVWADRLERHLDELAAMVVPQPPAGEVAGSHRDLNAHNVLFSPAGLRLVDWDAAGPAWVRWERADFAVRWGAEPFVRGYRDGGGTWDRDDADVLAMAPAWLLGWVVENIEMAVNDPTLEQDGVTAVLIDAVLDAPGQVAARQATLASALGR